MEFLQELDKRHQPGELALQNKMPRARLLQSSEDTPQAIAQASRPLRTFLRFDGDAGACNNRFAHHN